MAVEKGEKSFSEIRRIGEVSQAGVFVFNQSTGRFDYINSFLVSILEIDKKLLMAEPDVVLHSIPGVEKDYLKIRYAELLEKGFCEDVQIRIANNKIEKVLSLNAYIISAKSCIAGFVDDITKEKQHEEYLINFGARKDTILDMVSQNLSTPLNLSNFTIDLIEKAINEKKYHKISAHIKLMREVTSDCIRVINDFLQEEHLQSPNIDPKANRFDVVAKTLIVLEKLKLMNPEKQFKMTTRLKHLVISGDDVKYFQIVHNLLSNSIKFTRPSGFIEVTIADRRDQVEIKVRDDGIGIPDKLKPYVFEKKSPAGRPGLSGEISNGIGLFVCRELVTLMKGQISFESRENKGTTFTLQLPKGPRQRN